MSGWEIGETLIGHVHKLPKVAPRMVEEFPNLSYKIEDFKIWMIS